MMRYDVNFSKESDGYIVTSPEHPGVSFTNSNIINAIYGFKAEVRKTKDSECSPTTAVRQ